MSPTQFSQTLLLMRTLTCLQLKPGLQILPTRLNLSTWYPNTFSRHCLHHAHNTVTEPLSHILNGCNVQRGMYIAKLIRMVDLIVKGIMQYVRSSVKVCLFVNAMFFKILLLTHQMLVLLTRTVARSPFLVLGRRLSLPTF